jgi:hypothetical protein
LLLYLLLQVADGPILGLCLTRLGLESSVAVLELTSVAEQLRYVNLESSLSALTIGKLPA